MKTFFILLFLFVTCSLYSQADRIRYTLVYSLHLSDAAEWGPRMTFDPALAHSVFMNAELATKRSSQFTIGAGFLQSRLISRYFDHTTVENIEQHHNIYFLAVPAGLKFAFGSFYIHPEIAATYNFSLTTNSYVLDSEMNITDEPFDHDNSQRYFEVLFASFMTIGYEIKANSTSVLTGLKGFYAFNNNYVDTVGIGLTLGLKI